MEIFEKSHEDRIELAGMNRKSLILEASIVTLALLIVARALFALRGSSAVSQVLPTIVAILFLYVPVIVMWLRRRPIDFLESRWRGYLNSILIFGIAALVVFPPFLVAAHGWQILVGGFNRFRPAAFPNFAGIALYQVFLVALPEEFFFRGYFQSAMNSVFAKRVRFLGVNLGWGFIVTALVFAFAHTVVYYRWWHFAIFFPALVFGYLRERTGTITASMLFHASSNLIMDWFVRSYV